MQTGFIGTGSMGTILIESLIESKAITPKEIFVSNRTYTKAEALAQRYPGLTACQENWQVAQQSDLFFLCIRPLQFKEVIDEIRPFIRSDQRIVSITSPVEIGDLEQQLPAKIAKVIPSITNSVQSGASLIVVGERFNGHETQELFRLMKQISQPEWIDEKFTRVCSDIVSCGPAFLSYILQRLIQGAVDETGLSAEKASALTSQMLIGMAELLSKERFTLETLQERVCVPGGVTGEGLKVLEKRLEGVFNDMYVETHRKYAEDIEGVKTLFFEKQQKD